MIHGDRIDMMKDYKTEARERWSDTDAYREHEQKTKNYTKEKWAEVNDSLMTILTEFAADAIAVYCQEKTHD